MTLLHGDCEQATFARERDMEPIVTNWMHGQGLLVKREIFLDYGYCDLVGVEFDLNMVLRRQQRRKDFRPLHKRIIAVELKLHRIGEALRQAQNNLYAVEESYVAFPLNVAERIARKGIKDGIGLLGVIAGGCHVLVPAPRSRKCYEARVEHQVEKFWRDRLRLWAHESEAGLMGQPQEVPE